MRQMEISEDMVKSRLILGERIREQRKNQQLTQKQLGSIVGLDRARISRIERGLCNVTFDTILLIANGLGVSPSELFDGIGVPTYAAPDSIPLMY